MSILGLLTRPWTWFADAVNRVAARVEDEAEIDVDTESFPIEVVTPDNDLVAELTVPTQKEGATISQSGWNVGGDTIRRTTSKGTVEAEPYEDVVAELRVLEDEIELGVLLESGFEAMWEAKKESVVPERTIRIGLAEVTDVRHSNTEPDDQSALTKQHPELVFETASDVYKLSFRADNGALGNSSDFDGRWVADLADVIREESADRSPEDEASGADVIDQLERLKALHDEGALTDEEFEQQKTDLLDD